MIRLLDTEWIKGEMDRFQVPGISLGFLEGGKLRDAFYLGYADREEGRKVTPQTIYEAASLTKPVFAWYVYQLERQGLLTEETLLAEHLPEYPVCREKGAERITVLHTLTHSSGLENWGEKPLHLLFPPGEQFWYSGEGYTYLQAFVELLKQEKLDQLFEKEVFPKTQMQASAMTYRDADHENVAMTYGEDGRAQRNRYQVRELEKEPNAAYTLYTNLEDYCSFLGTLWEDQEMLEKMARPRLSASERGEKLFWGAGVGVWSGKKKMICHYGDNGNFKNLFFLETETGDGMVCFSNSFYGLETEFAIARRAFEEDFDEVEALTRRWK